MGRLAGKLSALAVLLLLAAVPAACGGGDEGSGSAGTTTSAQERAGEKPAAAGGDRSGKEGSGGQGEAPEGGADGSGEDSGGGPRQFRVQGGDNSIQEFGDEADREEFDQAAEAVHGFFDARVRGDWEAACAYVAQDIVEPLRPLAESLGEDAGCPQILAAISEGAPRSALEAAARADVGSVRIEDGQAFVLYHGAAGLDYAMPMRMEDGEWKVASLAGTPIS